MLTGLVKSPDARFLAISTAAARLDSALGRLRARVMAGKVIRKGAVIDALAPGMRWLERSLAEDRELTDFRGIKACNPARYISTGSLREQAERVTPIAFRAVPCLPLGCLRRLVATGGRLERRCGRLGAEGRSGGARGRHRRLEKRQRRRRRH